MWQESRTELRRFKWETFSVAWKISTIIRKVCEKGSGVSGRSKSEQSMSKNKYIQLQSLKEVYPWIKVTEDLYHSFEKLTTTTTVTNWMGKKSKPWKKWENINTNLKWSSWISQFRPNNKTHLWTGFFQEKCKYWL